MHGDQLISPYTTAWGPNDQSANYFGGYLQDQVKLPYGVQLMAGFRYQYVKQWDNLANQDMMSDDEVTPRFGLLWQPLRHPRRSLLALLGVYALAGAALGLGWVGFDFLPEAPWHGFEVAVEMPAGTPSSRTLAVLGEVEQRVKAVLKPGELQASLAQSGFIDKDGRTLYGHHFGAVEFSLAPKASRAVSELLPAIKTALQGLDGPASLTLAGTENRPAGKPISLKVGGNDGEERQAALGRLRAILEHLPGVGDISVEALDGLPELKLRAGRRGHPTRRAGPRSRRPQPEPAGRRRGRGKPGCPGRAGRRAGAGQAGGLPGHRRLAAPHRCPRRRQQRALAGAGRRRTAHRLRHHDFRRVQTVEARLDKSRLDTLAANRLIRARWDEVRGQYPGVSVEFTGEVEAVREGLDELRDRFLLGVGLIFLIAGAQFRSYRVPCLVLAKIPMALAGVVLGLLLSGEPLSLYTLYGGVALAGITVNSAILLFSAAADRIDKGMGVLHASIYAARRRLLPILITSTTTVAGLLPLALGRDEASALWRPVATAIVWGLGFSTLLTLFIVPLLFWLVMAGAKPSR